MNGLRRYVAVGLASAIAAGCAAPAVTASPAATAAQATGGAVSAAIGGLGERRHEAGAVTVAASWIEGSTPALDVALDTHSVDLDGLDLKALARVRLDGGDWIAPTAWTAPKGGHHRSGTLSFGTLALEKLASARLVELEVRDTGAASHLLRWERTG